MFVPRIILGAVLAGHYAAPAPCVELSEALALPISGLRIRSFNPVVGDDPKSRRAVDISVATDHSSGDPLFTNEQAMIVGMTAWNGQNSYGADQGGVFTPGKTSFIPLSVTLTSHAAGQKFASAYAVRAYGMGDSFLHSEDLRFASGPVAGDEGTSVHSVSYLMQQGNLTLTQISAKPSQATYTGNVVHAITASRIPQAVAVDSSAGAKAGDWIIVGHHGPNGYQTMEETQIISSRDSAITATFRNNHAAGATITPALVLELTNTSDFGQHRVLVNLTAPSYSEGKIRAISGGGFVGLGTKWSNGMAGGIANNVGAISLDADTYSGSPFNGAGGDLKGPLRSWFQILPNPTETSLGIHSFSTAGDRSYRGKGIGDGTYVIRPAARVMRISGTSIICETSNPEVWKPRDIVELAISPYPDVTGEQWAVGAYTPGGTYRGWYNLTNRGARTFGFGFALGGLMETGSNADTVPFDIGYVSAGSNYAFRSIQSRIAALALGAAYWGVRRTRATGSSGDRPLLGVTRGT